MVRTAAERADNIQRAREFWMGRTRARYQTALDARIRDVKFWEAMKNSPKPGNRLPETLGEKPRAKFIDRKIKINQAEADTLRAKLS